MNIQYNEDTRKFKDTETGIDASSKTQLRADIKRFRFKLPIHSFLSNRFILKFMEDLN